VCDCHSVGGVAKAVGAVRGQLDIAIEALYAKHMLNKTTQVAADVLRDPERRRAYDRGQLVT
jgi:hypothetical protein